MLEFDDKGGSDVVHGHAGIDVLKGGEGHNSLYGGDSHNRRPFTGARIETTRERAETSSSRAAPSRRRGSKQEGAAGVPGSAEGRPLRGHGSIRHVRPGRAQRAGNAFSRGATRNDLSMVERRRGEVALWELVRAVDSGSETAGPVPWAMRECAVVQSPAVASFRRLWTVQAIAHSALSLRRRRLPLPGRP